MTLYTCHWSAAMVTLFRESLAIDSLSRLGVRVCWCGSIRVQQFDVVSATTACCTFFFFSSSNYCIRVCRCCAWWVNDLASYHWLDLSCGLIHIISDAYVIIQRNSAEENRRETVIRLFNRPSHDWADVTALRTLRVNTACCSAYFCNI